MPPLDAPSKEWAVLRKDFEQTLKEVKVALEKNMRLLTFSMDHVKCSIEKMVSFINRSSYGRRTRSTLIGTFEGSVNGRCALHL